MDNCRRWMLVAVFLVGSFALRADDREATDSYRLGREACEKEDYARLRRDSKTPNCTPIRRW